VGNSTRVKVVKNKLAPPFKQVEFDIMYGEGVSKMGEILDLGVKAGIVEKSGAWFSYDSQRLGQGRENSKAFLKANRDHRQDRSLDPAEFGSDRRTDSGRLARARRRRRGACGGLRRKINQFRAGLTPGQVRSGKTESFSGIHRIFESKRALWMLSCRHPQRPICFWESRGGHASLCVVPAKRSASRNP
jgi:hypothetical protein